MSDATLVTALYFHLPTEKIGGRGWGFQHFKAPFTNILKLGCPIIVYTHDALHDQIQSYLEEQNFSEYKLINYDLTNFKYSNEIFRIKDLGSEPYHCDRNAHLCLQKPYWLQEQAQKNYFRSKNHFWIDAGLFHHGIFPEKYGGMERYVNYPPSRYYPENKDSSFTPEFGAALSRKVERFLCLIHRQQPINGKIMETLNAEGKALGYIVGGLFGGNKKYIDLMGKKSLW